VKFYNVACLNCKRNMTGRKTGYKKSAIFDQYTVFQKLYM